MIARSLVTVTALALVAARGLGAQGAAAATAPRRTIARLVAQPALAGSTPLRPTWSPDSRRLAFLWNAESRPREVWTTTRAGDAPVRVTRFTEGASRCTPSELAWLPAGDGLVVLCGGDAWRVSLAGGEPARLTTDGGGKGDLTLSPDGSTLAWLRDGDLWTMPLAGGAPVRRTALAKPPLDTIALGTYWRNDVEVGRATWASDAPPYAWSPDGKTIALHVVDRTRVRTVPFPSYLGAETSPHPLRRAYPGDSNEVRTVRLLDVARGEMVTVPLPAPHAWRVVNVEWSPDGTLWIDRERDDATERAIVRVITGAVETGGGAGADQATPASAVSARAVRPVYRDRRASRVYTDIGSAVGGTASMSMLVFTSDVGDRYRIYQPDLGDPDGAPTPMTPADADVEGTPILASGRLFWMSTAPDPSQRHVWVRDANGPQRITTFPGINTPYPSPDGGTLAVIAQSDTMPPELFVMPARAGGPEKRITVSPPAEFRRYTWAPARYVQVPSRVAGVQLHLRILEPPDIDRTKPHPVLIGPAYSNTVRNRWAGLYGMFQQHLAVDRGYVVVQVDMRGSTGYGRAFREAFLMDWGGGDLDDLEDVARWLRAQSWVDGKRVGIWGSSYGGTLTVYSLLRRPGLFDAGVAGAPAVDPFAFGSDDVAIARTPAEFPATFTRGALQYAANLRDPLLIIHGLMDDVVPFRTTAALAEELMRQGKDFELAIAPGATHGWTARPHHARYLLERLVDFFDRKMPARTGERPR